MIYRKVFFYSFLCSFLSCQNHDYKKEFIEKFGDEDFSNYIDCAVFFRSLDENGDLLYFYSPAEEICKSPYIVTVDKEMKKPIQVDAKLRIFPCDQAVVDTTAILGVVEDFLRYNVRLLKVDSDSVVYVNVDRAGEANLIKLPKSQSFRDFEGFKHVEGDWYFKE